MVNIFSLIPAYTGSTRLPGKNTTSFMVNGKPLLDYTIEAHKSIGFVPFLFTNERGLGMSYNGAIVVHRSDSVSTPTTTMNDTVQSFVHREQLDKKDLIILTYLTCPLRTGKHIKEALDLFLSKGYRSLQCLTPVDYRPFGLMYKEKGNEFKCMVPQGNYYRAQNTPTLYKANGAIYIFYVSELKKFNKQMFCEDTKGYILDLPYSIDIDTPFDVKVAEVFLKNGGC